MHQIIFALQFKGSAAPGTEGTLHAKTTAASQRLVTTLAAGRISGAIEGVAGDVAAFESEVRITGEGTFVESGTIRYGSAGSVTFTTVGQGVLGPSGIDGLQRGAVMWDVKGVDGMLAGASGLVTSNFSVGAAGEVIDNQFAQLFVR